MFDKVNVLRYVELIHQSRCALVEHMLLDGSTVDSRLHSLVFMIDPICALSSIIELYLSALAFQFPI
jgi:hypothetical protein